MADEAQSHLPVACYDDHPIVLDGVCRIIEQSGRYSVVSRGQSVADLDRDLETGQPEIVFMDFAMPGDVLAAIRRIANDGNAPRVIVFTANGESDIALKCLEAGARGFLVKDSLGDELIDAARHVMEGGIHISTRHAGRILLDLNKRARRTSEADKVSLSRREQQIVRLVGQAMSNKEIALALEISEKTVKNYMSTLMDKLSARNRVEVAMLAARSSDLSGSDSGSGSESSS